MGPHTGSSQAYVVGERWLGPEREPTGAEVSLPTSSSQAPPLLGAASEVQGDGGDTGNGGHLFHLEMEPGTRRFPSSPELLAWEKTLRLQGVLGDFPEAVFSFAKWNH